MARPFITIGPAQAWQSGPHQWTGDVAPLTRLALAGAAGLAIGRGGRIAGGLRSDTAARLAGQGLATIREGRAYATQLRLLP